MGTRSIIGILDGNTAKSVYCHWDGYPEHNGRILISSYQTKEKVEQLISGGSISSLGSTIEDTKFHNYPNDERSKFFSSLCHHQYKTNDKIPDRKTVLQDIHSEEFVYMFDCSNGMWYMLKQWEYEDQSEVIFVSEAIMELG